ncbi:Holliday junction branch migration protein RuvA [Candidatus Microgenomates bacterium]|nr:MAG: Holliday junction branch migration protein RuvA [Candidatus Microgenomates bacterium]
MIGSIEGVVEFKDNPHVIINVNGVGYRILIPVNLSSKLEIGNKVKVFTHTHVREDILDLYGFAKLEDLKLFEYLISVSGVGPKTALGIFSIGSREEIVNAIIRADDGFFTGVPRLGKKNAQKIIIELKSKLGSIADLDLTGQNSKEHGEIMEALKTFGFTAFEIQKALKETKADGKTAEEKIKLALKYLGK